MDQTAQASARLSQLMCVEAVGALAAYDVGCAHEVLWAKEESDYVYIFASPEKTDELCAPIETNSIYSCRKDQDVVLNFFRWQNGAVDFKNDMETYRIYLINHETGHILGWGHVGCPKEGAIAPVMMQQSKGTEGCIPYGWPAYETIKSKFNR
mgnify:CR=1 FL=1